MLTPKYCKRKKHEPCVVSATRAKTLNELKANSRKRAVIPSNPSQAIPHFLDRQSVFDRKTQSILVDTHEDARFDVPSTHEYC